MDDMIAIKSRPLGSLLRLTETQRSPYIAEYIAAPRTIQKLLTSPQTGSFIQGLTKTYNIDLEKAPTVAFALLQIAVGEKTLAQLGSILSTELKVANDMAQKMANEIEKELFAPIALELNNYLAQKKQTSSRPTGGAFNVLDLKNTTPPPQPPPIPKRY